MQTIPKITSKTQSNEDTLKSITFASEKMSRIIKEINSAPNISIFVIKNGDVVFINFPFKTENKAAKKAEIKPKTIPFTYCTSKPKMMTIPTNINKLITISLKAIFLLKSKGSNIDTNKVVIDMQTTPIETVLIFIE